MSVRARSFCGLGGVFEAAGVLACVAGFLALGCGDTGGDDDRTPAQELGGAPGQGGESSGTGANDSSGTGGDGSGTGASNGTGSTSSGGASTGGASTGGANTGGAGTGGNPNEITTATKLDILFVIDNSISMGDKQDILSKAVPGLLLDGLVHPPCLNGSGQSTPSNNGVCPDGYELAHVPLNDVHIGVITSALGSHGGTVCANTTPTVDNPNDLARLLPSVRASLAAQPDFISFSGGSLDATTAALKSQVVAASDRGCGYEAPLEAWFRFLVDPSPPATVAKDSNSGQTVQTGVDTEILAQRAQFLRPDSAVMIVVLTDENDCSVVDAGNGWAVTEPSMQFAKASEACDADPNDECCYSCFAQTPPAGCAASPRCDGSRVPASEDRGNVRCFEQKRRFGLDLLYPTQRYIDALTKVEIDEPYCSAASCPKVQNPLFPAVGEKVRSPSMVFLLGIVGVPWQDLSTTSSLTDPTELTYLSPAALEAAGRWNVILGDPHASPPKKPTDPLMIESIVPRSGTNPITGDAIASYTSPHGNAINGNETNNLAIFTPDGSKPANDDLQYSCIFPLSTPMDCTDATNKIDCDCWDGLDKVRPLCQKDAVSAQENKQYYAKAYPAPRILEVLHGIGESGIVTSICPKNPSGSATDPNYGYNPALFAGQRALWNVLE
jgi:hypothetical protein